MKDDARGPARIAIWESASGGRERRERNAMGAAYAAGAKKGSAPLRSHAESGYARICGSS